MIKKSWPLGGKNLFFETGRIAKQADGSVLVGIDATVVLVTAVASKDRETTQDFFPLTVEYREKFYAAGKIPGGFFRREGRPGEKETLGARLIDRPIRPMFPDTFRYEVQVACSVLSSDQRQPSDVLGITGASLALALSDIPFSTILSGVRVGLKDNKFIVNPLFSELDEGLMDLAIAGSDDAIIMVEGGANIGTVLFQRDVEFKQKVRLDVAADFAGALSAMVLALVLRDFWALVWASLIWRLTYLGLSYRMHPYRPRLCWDRTRALQLIHFGKHVFWISVVTFIVTNGDDALVGRAGGVPTRPWSPWPNCSRRSTRSARCRSRVPRAGRSTRRRPAPGPCSR